MPRPLNTMYYSGFKSLNGLQGLGFASVAEGTSDAIVPSDCASTDALCLSMAAANQQTIANYNSPITWLTHNWPWLVGGLVVALALTKRR